MNYNYTIQYDKDVMDGRSEFKITCEDWKLQEYVSEKLQDSILDDMSDVKLIKKFSFIKIEVDSSNDYSSLIEILVKKIVDNFKEDYENKNLLEVCYLMPSSLECNDLDKFGDY